MTELSPLEAIEQEIRQDIDAGIKLADQDGRKTHAMKLRFAATVMALDFEDFKELWAAGILDDLENMLVSLTPLSQISSVPVCRVCNDEAHDGSCRLQQLQKLCQKVFGVQ